MMGEQMDRVSVDYAIEDINDLWNKDYLKMMFCVDIVNGSASPWGRHNGTIKVWQHYRLAYWSTTPKITQMKVLC